MSSPQIGFCRYRRDILKEAWKGFSVRVSGVAPGLGNAAVGDVGKHNSQNDATYEITNSWFLKCGWPFGLVRQRIRPDYSGRTFFGGLDPGGARRADLVR